MRKKLLIFTVLMLSLSFSSVHSQSKKAISTLDGISLKEFSAIDRESLRDVSCKRVTYEYARPGQAALFMLDITTTSNPVYVYSYRILTFTYGYDIQYNNSVRDDMKEKGPLIFNRDELEKNNWKIPANTQMVVLTTAEYLKNAKFEYNWKFDKPQILYEKMFFVPNYALPKADIAKRETKKEPLFDIEIKTFIFCDYDGNPDTTGDNFVTSYSKRIIVNFEK